MIGVEFFDGVVECGGGGSALIITLSTVQFGSSSFNM